MDGQVALFKALADRTRLRLLRVLCSGSFNVNELVGVLALGQSRVSRHLKVLLDAGLVQTRREGSWVYYALSDAWWSTDPGERPTSSVLSALAAGWREQASPEQPAIEACLEARRLRAARFFSDVASSWDDQRDAVQGRPAYLDRIVASLGATGQSGVDTLVDLGTGTGVLLSRLSPLAERVIGIDASSEMLRVARDNAVERGLDNVELRLGALEHLPLPDGAADVMVANMVLHHVAQPSAALREVRRGLRPRGRVFIADFKKHEEESYRDKLGDLWLGFDEQELERWLAEADLAVESVEEITDEQESPSVFLAVASRREE